MNLVLMKTTIKHSSTTKIVLCITNKGPASKLKCPFNSYNQT